MWKIFVLAVFVAMATALAFPANESAETTTSPGSSNSLSDSNGTANASGIKPIEFCDQVICETHICHINNSISRASFYARCPNANQLESEPELAKYCMCAAAYHAAPVSTEPGEHRQTYITITPGDNCQVPVSEGDKLACEQERCQGVSKKSNRLAHICTVDDKYYCACFN